MHGGFGQTEWTVRLEVVKGEWTPAIWLSDRLEGDRLLPDEDHDPTTYTVTVRSGHLVKLLVAANEPGAQGQWDLHVEKRDVPPVRGELGWEPPDLTGITAFAPIELAVGEGVKIDVSGDELPVVDGYRVFPMLLKLPAGERYVLTATGTEHAPLALWIGHGIGAWFDLRTGDLSRSLGVDASTPTEHYVLITTPGPGMTDEVLFSVAAVGPPTVAPSEFPGPTEGFGPWFGIDAETHRWSSQPVLDPLVGSRWTTTFDSVTGTAARVAVRAPVEKHPQLVITSPSGQTFTGGPFARNEGWAYWEGTLPETGTYRVDVEGPAHERIEFSLDIEQLGHVDGKRPPPTTFCEGLSYSLANTLLGWWPVTGERLIAEERQATWTIEGARVGRYASMGAGFGMDVELDALKRQTDACLVGWERSEADGVTRWKRQVYDDRCQVVVKESEGVVLLTMECF